MTSTLKYPLTAQRIQRRNAKCAQVNKIKAMLRRKEKEQCQSPTTK
jgi:hypothetical protein